jgi:hypothetical protein
MARGAAAGYIAGCGTLFVRKIFLGESHSTKLEAAVRGSRLDLRWPALVVDRGRRLR